MKNWKSLDTTQRELVERNTSLVKKVIYLNIDIHEDIPNLGYEDIYQEGCIWLCRAASTFVPGVASFKTYAQTVIRNGLLSHCKRILAKNIGAVSFDALSEQKLEGPLCTIPAEWDWLRSEERIEMRELLESRKGISITSRDIAVLNLQMDGVSTLDIATMYGIRPSLVRAWASRAAAKLREDKRFLSSL